MRSPLAESLRIHRLRADIEQAVLAKKLGVKQQQVSKWENDRAKPAARHIPGLSETLGIDKGFLEEQIIEPIVPADAFHRLDVVEESYEDLKAELGEIKTMMMELLDYAKLIAGR